MDGVEVWVSAWWLVRLPKVFNALGFVPRLCSDLLF